MVATWPAELAHSKRLENHLTCVQLYTIASAPVFAGGPSREAPSNCRKKSGTTQGQQRQQAARRGLEALSGSPQRGRSRVSDAALSDPARRIEGRPPA